MEDGCIGPSSLEEEALAAQGQPEKPSGPADSAGVALIEAACVRETVAQNTWCQDRWSWTAAGFSRRVHEGMDMGCSRIRKERLDNLAQQTVTTWFPTPLLGNTNTSPTKSLETSRSILCT